MSKNKSKREEQLNMAILGADLGMWDWDMINNIIKINSLWAAMLGYSMEELGGSSLKFEVWKNIVHPDDFKKTLQLFNDHVLKNTEIYEAEFRMKHKNGSWVWILARGKVLEWENNKPLRALGTHLDITKTKKAEQQIRESEKKYISLFEQSADGILVGINNGEIVEANQSMTRLTGYSKEELVGQNIKILFDPEVLKDKPLRYDLIKKGTAIIIERNLLRKDGTYLSTEMNTKMLDDGRMQALFRDISKRKVAENALKNSEQKYRMLFESANDAIFIMDKEIFIDCNKKTLDMFACTREQIIGQPPYKFSPEYQPDGLLSKEKALHKIQEALNGGTNAFEWLHKRLNGETFNAEVSLNAFNHKGKLYIQAIVRNITDRKKAEKLILDKEEKIRNIYESSSDIIMIINQNEKVININKAVEKNLGYTIDEFIGKSPSEFIVESDIEKVRHRISRMLAGEKVPIGELIMLSKAGEKVPVEVNSRQINYEGEKAILSVIRNIKERKELEQKVFDVMIETEENERHRLASDIHDEVGPLLSSLKMYIEMLNETKAPDKQKFVHNKLKTLIKESIVNVREVSNALSPNLLNQYGLETAIQAFIKSQEELIEIHFRSNIDEERFGIKLETVYYRILKELINNTLKHAKAKNIKIDIEKKDNNLILTYSDDGNGFNNSKLKYYKSKGQGLTNIETRVKTINGKYSFTTNNVGGFYFEMVTKVNK